MFLPSVICCARVAHCLHAQTGARNKHHNLWIESAHPTSPNASCTTYASGNHPLVPTHSHTQPLRPLQGRASLHSILPCTLPCVFHTHSSTGVCQKSGGKQKVSCHGWRGTITAVKAAAGAPCQPERATLPLPAWPSCVARHCR